MNLVVMTAIILVYLAAIAYLGFSGYKNSKTEEGFLLAGRNTHPFIMAMSYGATFISTSAIVGYGGAASAYGLSLLWLTFFNIFVGIFIAFIVFGKRTRIMGLNLDAHTFPELMARRVDSRFVQIFSGIIIFLFMPIYTAAVLMGAARILENFLNLNYNLSIIVFTLVVGTYVILGGLKGVMLTDALQGTLMFIGLAALLIITFSKLGGLIESHSALSSLRGQIPDYLQEAGITSWTHSPAAGTPMWWIIYSSIVLGVGIGVLVQPQLIVRFLTVKSSKELNRAVLIGGTFILMVTGASFIVGALSNVYFFDKYGVVSLVYAENNMDRVIPLFIGEIMPNWFNYFFVLIILSAAMSTLSSQFHTIGTSLGRDVIEKGIAAKKPLKRNVAPLLNRIGIVIALVITVSITYRMGLGIIARATAIFFSLMASAFLAPYILTVYWKRYTKAGAISGILSGFSTAVFGSLFLHKSVAVVFSASEFLFGRETLTGGLWPYIDPLVIAVPASAIVTVIVSFATKAPDPELVRKSFKGLR